MYKNIFVPMALDHGIGEAALDVARVVRHAPCAVHMMRDTANND